MRFAVETTGTLRSTDSVLDRATLEADFDAIADALADLHDLEADVSIDLETAQLEFFIVIDASDSREAFRIAYELQDRALAAAEVGLEWNVGVEWNEAHARIAA